MNGYVFAKIRQIKRTSMKERKRENALIRASEIRILTVFIELGNFIYGYFIEFAR